MEKAQKAEVVVITSDADKTHVAKLEAIHPAPKKRLGALATAGFSIPDEFFESMSEEELRLWNGEDDIPVVSADTKL